MAPHLETNWQEYIQHVKFWRNEVKRSLGEAITRLELLTDLDGQPALLGLATAPGDSASNQMIMHARIPMDAPFPVDDNEERPILEMKPLVDTPQLFTPLASAAVTNDSPQQGKPPPELALHYERLRGQIVGGVTAYTVHVPTRAILLSTYTQLLVYKNNELKSIAQWLPQSASVLNAAFCKVAPEYVAFNSGNQLFIDKENTNVFASDTRNPHITNGVASFAMQEEFDRYEGYWWSPTRPELLYERVDESTIVKLAFTLPGARADEQPMRYPLAGTPNATTEPRICRLDESTGLFVDHRLDGNLKEAAPWMEYIVRIGWSQDGDFVYMLVMNRLQTQMGILLVPNSLFVPLNTQTEEKQGVGQIRMIYQEESPDWINANNLLYFLPPANSADTEDVLPAQVRFVLGSERTDKCHLYLQTFDNNSINSQPITAAANENDHWTVLKEATLKVDPNRGLVFFLANRHSILILSICVARIDNNQPAECRVLTPSNLSYKFERSDPTLYLNPDVGFVCWLSAVDRLPECRFYRLVYSPDDPLPQAHFTHRIGVQLLSPSIDLGPTSGWGLPQLHRSPSSIFSHRFVQFDSLNSGQIHHGLVLWPANASRGQSFPVIQAVYAGPTIQLVKNSWQTISQYLKFVSFGYAVLVVDGRGSANRGVKFEASIKERLGTVEIEDQLEGLQQVAQQMDGLLDLKRVAVIGWSYGGYVSLQLLAEYPTAYKCACVGGAVTDWQLYDTAYTERYMGMPQQNVDCYKHSTVLSKISKLPNQEGRLLIVHGMIDENVHFQHTVRLINALIGAQKPHQLLLFPGERHAIRQGESIEHFHATILAFFGRALGGGSNDMNASASFANIPDEPTQPMEITNQK